MPYLDFNAQLDIPSEDFLDLSHWGRAEMLPIDYINWGGQSNWPVSETPSKRSSSQFFFQSVER